MKRECRAMAVLLQAAIVATSCRSAEQKSDIQYDVRVAGPLALSDPDVRGHRSGVGPRHCRRHASIIVVRGALAGADTR